MTDPMAAASSKDLPILVSDRVLLRQPLPDDIATRLEVPADPELHRMYGGSGDPVPMTRARIEEGLHSISNQDLSKVRRFLIAARVWPDGRPIESPHGRYIGHTRLTIASWEDRRARMSMGIYDSRFWSAGYGTEALRLLLRYGFDLLRLHRVDLRVLDYNLRAIRCYEKCGFVREGVERESGLVDGVWYDDVMMAVLEDEFRALA